MVKKELQKAQGLEVNPRRITDKGLKMLVDSILEFPSMMSARPIVLNGEGTVLGGNQRVKALTIISTYDIAQIKRILSRRKTFTRKTADKRAAIISFWEEWLAAPYMYADVRDDWDEVEQEEFVVKDNVSAGEFDAETLAATYDTEVVAEWGIDLPSLTEMYDELTNDEDDDPDDPDDEFDEDDDPDDSEDKDAFYRAMLGDKLYDSDNIFDIPSLRIDRQPTPGIELPVAAWGSQSRKLRACVNTYHFYVDDYRFEALWKDPLVVLRSGCRAIVEPNCSCHDQTPIAYGLSLIYKKRYLARYYQECGLTVYADLNVAPKFMEYNKLGIPNGYNAFATRGAGEWLAQLDMVWQTAQEISGLERPNLIVYGGGEACKQFCREHGATYLEQFINNIDHKLIKSNNKKQ